MKEKIKHLDEFDIGVKCFLGYDELQNIIETTLNIDNYGDRQKNIDMLVLHYCAGIPIEELENTDPDVYLKSGMVDAVKYEVQNFNEIHCGIEYYMSTTRLLGSLVSAVQSLPETPEFKNIIENGISK